MSGNGRSSEWNQAVGTTEEDLEKELVLRMSHLGGKSENNQRKQKCSKRSDRSKKRNVFLLKVRKGMIIDSMIFVLRKKSSFKVNIQGKEGGTKRIVEVELEN